VTLSRYLSTLFLQAFLGISGGLTVIYNLIELMEKLTRTTHDLPTILPFLGLNLVPTWLDMLPISAWLAILVVIYRLQLHEEWFTCRLLGLKNRQLLLPLVFTTACIAIGVIGIRHGGGEALRTKVQHYHARVFKRRATNILHNQWYALPSLDLVHIQHFSYATQRGRGLTWYRYGDQGIRMHEYCAIFTLEKGVLRAPRGEQYHYDTGQWVTRFSIQQPAAALTHALQERVHAPSLVGLLTAWWNTTPHSQHHTNIGTKLGQEALPLVEIMVFALLTLLLFLALPLGTRYPLVLAASSYPLCLLLKSLLNAWWPSSFLVVVIGYCALLAVAKVSGSRILRIAITRF
jgi:hypothetical protein